MTIRRVTCNVHELLLSRRYVKDRSTIFSKSGGTVSCFKAQNSSEVHHNTSSAAHFRGLCVPGGIFLHDFAGGCCFAPPTYFCQMNNHVLIKQPNSTGSRPNCLFIPLLWLLCISEIAKIVDPGLWNSTSFTRGGRRPESPPPHPLKTCSVLLRDKETGETVVYRKAVRLTQKFPFGGVFLRGHIPPPCASTSQSSSFVMLRCKAG